MKTRAKIRTMFVMAVLGLLVLGSAAARADITDGLVAHWKFDEGSGRIAHDSAGSNHGTLYGDTIWTAGWLNGALDFDGDRDFVEVPDDDSLTSQSSLQWLFGFITGVARPRVFTSSPAVRLVEGATCRFSDFVRFFNYERR